jgi:hypothetical protein
MAEYPDTIYVSGSPLLLRGFNGAYEKREIDNNVEYHLINHIYYGILIRHTRILNNKGKWFLQTVDDHCPVYINHNSDKLLGDWGDVLITDKQGISTWFRSNSSFVITGTAIIALACAWLASRA